MKKIGFIDYFIDEWHANKYPGWIREAALKDKFNIALAWEEFTPEGKKNIDEWCAEFNVEKAACIEQIVEECDCICVLSPDNSERHEDLADLPLKSGKPVYVDKTFAPSLAAAKRMFAKAEAHNTPLMSSSALRFGTELKNALQEIGDQPVNNAVTFGSGRNFEIYAIHQLEMIVKAIGTGATSVLQHTNGTNHTMLIEYPDQRMAAMHFVPGQPFEITLQYGEDKAIRAEKMGDFFPRFIDDLLVFFDTGVPCVLKEETLEIAALIEAGNTALSSPGKWIEVPR
jgi:hypothetical protein